MKSARDQYRTIYQQELDHEAEWLRACAIAKVDSIQALLAGHGVRPRKMLELGCGTGAVILECQRRGIASDFVAVDYSPEAIEILARSATNIRAYARDIADASFDFDEHFDVVVLSHVLEHMERPDAFLTSLVKRGRFDYLVAEVPLEDLPGARFKMLFKDRARNTAGHVQFFTETTFRALLAHTGLDVVLDRRYLPILSRDILRAQRRRGAFSRFGELLRMATSHYLPRLLGPLWKRLYYAHYAVLCTPRDRVRE